jgi:hypothetical protein
MTKVIQKRFTQGVSAPQNFGHKPSLHVASQLHPVQLSIFIPLQPDGRSLAKIRQRKDNAVTVKDQKFQLSHFLHFRLILL